ncbi:protein kinase [Candidatus Woesearchaeota archaeon]|nr:protein kinase [Candidatus Woesearchaeota archaeon]
MKDQGIKRHFGIVHKILETKFRDSGVYPTEEEISQVVEKSLKIVEHIEAGLHYHTEGRKQIVQSLEEYFLVVPISKLPVLELLRIFHPGHCSFYNRWLEDRGSKKETKREKVLGKYTERFMPSGYEDSVDDLMDPPSDTELLKQIARNMSINALRKFEYETCESVKENEGKSNEEKRKSMDEVTERYLQRMEAQVGVLEGYRKPLEMITGALRNTLYFIDEKVEEQEISFESDYERFPITELIKERPYSILMQGDFMLNLERLILNRECRSDKELVEVASISIPDYTARCRIGEGAGSYIYLADSRFMDGEVKLKIFKENPEDKLAKAYGEEGLYTEDGKVDLEKIIRRRMANLKGVDDKRHITDFYGAGTCLNPVTGQETFYLALEYVEGGAVETKNENGEYVIRDDIEEKHVMPIYRGLLEGLRVIHGSKKVLKDIKLRNLLVDIEENKQTGVPEVTLVKIDDLETISGLDEVYRGERKTEGSDRYAAPELRYPDAKATVKSDLYSAGVCLLYLVTRKPKLMEETIKDENEYNQHLQRVLQEVPEQYREFLGTALAFNPGDRHNNVQEMLDALEPGSE